MNILSLTEKKFAKEICQQDPNFHMASLEAYSLFTGYSPRREHRYLYWQFDSKNLPNIYKHDFGNFFNVTT